VSLEQLGQVQRHPVRLWEQRSHPLDEARVADQIRELVAQSGPDVANVVGLEVDVVGAVEQDQDREDFCGRQAHFGSRLEVLRGAFSLGRKEAGMFLQVSSTKQKISVMFCMRSHLGWGSNCVATRQLPSGPPPFPMAASNPGRISPSHFSYLRTQVRKVGWA
jgi:hypothetical protein